MSRITSSTPGKDGFYMPGEYESHEGTLMIYPTRPGSWGKDRTDALRSLGTVYKEILKREKLFLLADSEHMGEAKSFLEGVIHSLVSDADAGRGAFRETEIRKRLCLIQMESDDAWARDVGPTFVKSKNGDVRGINWSFNAWGGEVDGLYASWDKDDKVAGLFCEELGTDWYDAAPFVLEGGSIHSDGDGTIMVTDSCLLSRGRNPEMTRQQIENKLCEYLGGKKVLWLPYGIYNDETNEHVDNVCAFIRPGEVVLACTDDESDPQFDMSFLDQQYLEGETDAKGRKIKVHKLPVPEHPVLITAGDLGNFEFEEGEDNREEGERLAASYVNFYFLNGAVLVPQFGGDNTQSDKRAIEILKELCPDREVIGIDAGAILLGGGNIHCMTQQIPYGIRAK